MAAMKGNTEWTHFRQSGQSLGRVTLTLKSEDEAAKKLGQGVLAEQLQVQRS